MSGVLAFVERMMERYIECFRTVSLMTEAHKALESG